MAGVGARVMFGVPLVGLGSGVDARSALNIIYIMRNDVSAGSGPYRLERLLPQRNPASSTLPKPSEFAVNGGWAWVYPVPTPNRPIWST